VTTDEVLIRSILEDPTVIDGFSDGERLDSAILADAVYFHEPDVGLFPSRISGDFINVHAAIPKKNRGIKAVKAAKKLGKYLTLIGFNAYTTVRKNNSSAIRFNHMVGLTRVGELDNHFVYRYL